jgi:hypothetical protein
VTDTLDTNLKVRPLIIIRPPERDLPGCDFDVACASTTKPLENEVVYTVELPHSKPHGHRWTRLKEPTWVYCYWLRTLKIKDIVNSGGLVHENQMRSIFKIINDLDRLGETL